MNTEPVSDFTRGMLWAITLEAPFVIALAFLLWPAT